MIHGAGPHEPLAAASLGGVDYVYGKSDPNGEHMADISSSKILSYESSLEPGDRFEVSAADAHLLIPEALSALGAAIEVLEDEHGQPLPLTPDATGRRLGLSE